MVVVLVTDLALVVVPVGPLDMVMGTVKVTGHHVVMVVVLGALLFGA